MSTKYGQVFKVNYTVRRGFHVILSMAHNSVTHDFPDELEIVSFDSIDLIGFLLMISLVQSRLKSSEKLAI